MWNPFSKPTQVFTTQIKSNNPPLTATELIPHSAVNRNFVSHLMGGGLLHDHALSPDESKVVSSMRDWVRSPQASAALPRLPATLPKLMGLLRREEVSIPELAEHLSHDPALLGAMMRIANSPFYRTSRPVASVADAVQMIGQSGLSQLVIRVSMGPVFGGQKGHFSKTASGPLWEQAERCAHASAWLRRGKGDAFDAYLAGMVASTGLISVLRMLDREMSGQQAPNSADFYTAVHECSVHLSATVAQQWDFPERVVQAMVARESQLQGAAQGAGVLPAALSFALDVQCADRCAKLVVLHRFEAMDVVTSVADAACVQEILHCFEKTL